MEPKAKEDTTVSPNVRTHDNKIDVVGGSNDDGGGDLGTTGGTGEEGGGGGMSLTVVESESSTELQNMLPGLFLKESTILGGKKGLVVEESGAGSVRAGKIQVQVKKSFGTNHQNLVDKFYGGDKQGMLIAVMASNMKDEAVYIPEELYDVPEMGVDRIITINEGDTFFSSDDESKWNAASEERVSRQEVSDDEEEDGDDDDTTVLSINQEDHHIVQEVYFATDKGDFLSFEVTVKEPCDTISFCMGYGMKTGKEDSSAAAHSSILGVIGEEFVISETPADSSLSLEWDLSNTIMERVLSPSEMASISSRDKKDSVGESIARKFDSTKNISMFLPQGMGGQAMDYGSIEIKMDVISIKPGFDLRNGAWNAIHDVVKYSEEQMVKDPEKFGLNARVDSSRSHAGHVHVNIETGSFLKQLLNVMTFKGEGIEDVAKAELLKKLDDDEVVRIFNEGGGPGVDIEDSKDLQIFLNDKVSSMNFCFKVMENNNTTASLLSSGLDSNELYFDNAASMLRLGSSLSDTDLLDWGDKLLLCRSLEEEFLVKSIEEQISEVKDGTDDPLDLASDAKKVAALSDEIADIDSKLEDLFPTPASQVNEDDVVAALSDKLDEMLENISENIDGVIEKIDEGQDLMDKLHENLEAIVDFRSTFNSFTTASRNIYTVVNTTYRLLDVMLPVASTALPPVGAIIRLVRPAMGTLRSALRTSRDRVSNVNTRLRNNSFLNQTERNQSRLARLSEGLDSPISVLERFKEVIELVKTLAFCGVLKDDIIRDLLNQTGIEGLVRTITDQCTRFFQPFEQLRNRISNVNQIFRPITDIYNRISGRLEIFDPIVRLFNNLDPKVKRAARIFRNRFMRLVMRGINKVVNLIIRPFQNTINAIVQRVNPFGDFNHNFFDEIETELHNTLSVLFNNLSLPFANFMSSLEPFVAVIYSGFYTMIDQMFESASTKVEIFQQMLGGSLQSLLQSEQSRFGPLYTTSDLIVEMRQRVSLVPRNMCDLYQQIQHGSLNRYRETDSGIESRIRSFVSGNVDYRECYINPEQVNVIAANPYTFYQGAESMSWLNGPISLALFHGSVTRLGKEWGVLDDPDKIKCDFLPQINHEGQCDVVLHTKEDPETLTVDCRLPFNSVSVRSYSGAPESILGDLLENTRLQIFRDINECFPCGEDGSGYLALIQKSVLAHLNVASQESVGSGIRLLTGKDEMRCYKRDGGGYWQAYNTAVVEGSDMSRVVKKSDDAIGNQMNDVDLLKRMKDFTLSTYDVVAINDTSQKEDMQFQKQLNSAFAHYSLFVFLTSNKIANPVLFKDPTDEQNLLYSTPHGPQPLFDLKECQEIWELEVGKGFSFEEGDKFFNTDAHRPTWNFQTFSVQVDQDGIIKMAGVGENMIGWRTRSSEGSELLLQGQKVMSEAIENHQTVLELHAVDNDTIEYNQDRQQGSFRRILYSLQQGSAFFCTNGEKDWMLQNCHINFNTDETFDLKASSIGLRSLSQASVLSLLRGEDVECQILGNEDKLRARLIKDDEGLEIICSPLSNRTELLRFSMGKLKFTVRHGEVYYNIGIQDSTWTPQNFVVDIDRSGIMSMRRVGEDTSNIWSTTSLEQSLDLLNGQSVCCEGHESSNLINVQFKNSEDGNRIYCSLNGVELGPFVKGRLPHLLNNDSRFYNLGIHQGWQFQNFAINIDGAGIIRMVASGPGKCEPNIAIGWETKSLDQSVQLLKGESITCVMLSSTSGDFGSAIVEFRGDDIYCSSNGVEFGPFVRGHLSFSLSHNDPFHSARMISLDWSFRNFTINFDTDGSISMIRIDDELVGWMAGSVEDSIELLKGKTVMCDILAGGKMDVRITSSTSIECSLRNGANGGLNGIFLKGEIEPLVKERDLFYTEGSIHFANGRDDIYQRGTFQIIHHDNSSRISLERCDHRFPSNPRLIPTNYRRITIEDSRSFLHGLKVECSMWNTPDLTSRRPHAKGHIQVMDTNTIALYPNPSTNQVHHFYGGLRSSTQFVRTSRLVARQGTVFTLRTIRENPNNVVSNNLFEYNYFILKLESDGCISFKSQIDTLGDVWFRTKSRSHSLYLVDKDTFSILDNSSHYSVSSNLPGHWILLLQSSEIIIYDEPYPQSLNNFRFRFTRNDRFARDSRFSLETGDTFFCVGMNRADWRFQNFRMERDSNGIITLAGRNETGQCVGWKTMSQVDSACLLMGRWPFGGRLAACNIIGSQDIIRVHNNFEDRISYREIGNNGRLPDGSFLRGHLSYFLKENDLFYSTGLQGTDWKLKNFHIKITNNGVLRLSRAGEDSTFGWETLSLSDSINLLQGQEVPVSVTSDESDPPVDGHVQMTSQESLHFRSSRSTLQEAGVFYRGKLTYSLACGEIFSSNKDLHNVVAMIDPYDRIMFTNLEDNTIIGSTKSLEDSVKFLQGEKVLVLHLRSEDIVKDGIQTTNPDFNTLGAKPTGSDADGTYVLVEGSPRDNESTSDNFEFDLASSAYASNDFESTMTIKVDENGQTNTAASIQILGGRIGFNTINDRFIFIQGGLFGSTQNNIVAPAEVNIATYDEPFTFTMKKRANTVTFFINGNILDVATRTLTSSSDLGTFGFRPWRGNFKIYDWSISGAHNTSTYLVDRNLQFVDESTIVLTLGDEEQRLYRGEMVAMLNDGDLFYHCGKDKDWKFNNFHITFDDGIVSLVQIGVDPQIGWRTRSRKDTIMLFQGKSAQCSVIGRRTGMVDIQVVNDTTIEWNDSSGQCGVFQRGNLQYSFTEGDIFSGIHNHNLFPTWLYQNYVVAIAEGTISMKLADKETGWTTDSVETSIKLLNGERVECNVFPPTRFGQDMMDFQILDNNTIFYDTPGSQRASLGRFDKGELIYSLNTGDKFCAIKTGNLDIRRSSGTIFLGKNHRLNLVRQTDNVGLRQGEIARGGIQPVGGNSRDRSNIYYQFLCPDKILCRYRDTSEEFTLYRGQMIAFVNNGDNFFSADGRACVWRDFRTGFGFFRSNSDDSTWATVNDHDTVRLLMGHQVLSDQNGEVKFVDNRTFIHYPRNREPQYFHRGSPRDISWTHRDLNFIWEDGNLGIRPPSEMSWQIPCMKTVTPEDAETFLLGGKVEFVINGRSPEPYEESNFRSMQALNNDTINFFNSNGEICQLHRGNWSERGSRIKYRVFEESQVKEGKYEPVDYQEVAADTKGSSSSRAAISSKTLTETISTAPTTSNTTKTRTQSTSTSSTIENFFRIFLDKMLMVSSNVSRSGRSHSQRDAAQRSSIVRSIVTKKTQPLFPSRIEINDFVQEKRRRRRPNQPGRRELYIVRTKRVTTINPRRRRQGNRRVPVRSRPKQSVMFDVEQIFLGQSRTAPGTGRTLFSYTSTCLRQASPEVLPYNLVKSIAEVFKYERVARERNVQDSPGMMNPQRQFDMNGIGQNDCVHHWAIQYSQWKDYFKYLSGEDGESSRKNKVIWEKHNVHTVYPSKEEEKGWMDVNAFNKYFVIKNTVGSGLSVSLLMQNGFDGTVKTRNNLKNAQVMISHTWGEDITQVYNIFEKVTEDGSVILSDRRGPFGADTVMFFCVTSIFQPNVKDLPISRQDRRGPTVPEQTGMKPDFYERIIRNKSVTDFIVLQTDTIDPYSRLYCTLELFFALERNEKAVSPENLDLPEDHENKIKKIGIHPLFSEDFLKRFVSQEGGIYNIDLKWIQDPQTDKLTPSTKLREPEAEQGVPVKKSLVESIQEVVTQRILQGRNPSKVKTRSYNLLERDQKGKRNKNYSALQERMYITFGQSKDENQVRDYKMVGDRAFFRRYMDGGDDDVNNFREALHTEKGADFFDDLLNHEEYLPLPDQYRKLDAYNKVTIEEWKRVQQTIVDFQTSAIIKALEVRDAKM